MACAEQQPFYEPTSQLPNDEHQLFVTRPSLGEKLLHCLFLLQTDQSP